MTKKKAAKRVIDYDPLAWMDEEPELSSSENIAAGDEDLTTVVAGSEQGDSWGFFDDEESSAQTMDQASTEDDVGYGFFDDEPSSGIPSTVTATYDAESGVIDLGADLTIRSVADCKSIVDQCLGEDEAVTLSTERLQKIDTAGLQLLLSLDLTLRAKESAITWLGDTQLVNDGAQRLGLAPFAHGSTAAETGTEDAAESDDAGFGFF